MIVTESDYTPPARPADLRPGETWCRCGAVWRRQTRLAHCSRGGCHRTFTGLANFDAHQVITCARCAVSAPCPSGNHTGPRTVNCLSGPAAPPEIVADADGRYKGPSGNVDALRRAAGHGGVE